eukprot:2250539-Prymnesium_polylepis.3
MIESSLEGNQAGSGGAAYVGGGSTMVVEQSVFIANSAVSSGGALQVNFQHNAFSLLNKARCICGTEHSSSRVQPVARAALCTFPKAACSNTSCLHRLRDGSLSVRATHFVWSPAPLILSSRLPARPALSAALRCKNSRDRAAAGHGEPREDGTMLCYALTLLRFCCAAVPLASCAALRRLNRKAVRQDTMCAPRPHAMHLLFALWLRPSLLTAMPPCSVLEVPWLPFRASQGAFPTRAASRPRMGATSARRATGARRGLMHLCLVPRDGSEPHQARAAPSAQ